MGWGPIVGLSPAALGFQHMQLLSGFYVVPGDLNSYLPACTAHGLLSHLPGSPRQLMIKLCTCNYISVSLKFSRALQPCRCRVSQGTFTSCKQS